MSDPHDPTYDGRAADDAPLSPEQEAALRRLLRGARHTEPTPEAVATRLDDVIAGLARERAAGTSAVTDLPPRAVPPLPGTTADHHPGPTPAPLDLDAARRRRGRLTTVFLAAAAVVVAVGVGGVVLPQVTGSGQDDAATSDQSSETSQEQQEDGAGAAEAPPQAAPTPDDVAPEENIAFLARIAPVPGTVLGAPDDRDLPADVTVEDATSVLAAAAASAGRALDPSTCGGVSADEGGVLTSYDGSPALLVVEIVGGDDPTSALLSLRDCGSGDEVWSAVVGAR